MRRLWETFVGGIKRKKGLELDLYGRYLVRMITVFDGRLAGTFEGYGPGRLHTLDNGVVWQQVDHASATLHCESPRCRVLWDPDRRRYFIDVAGTGSMAEVRRR